VTDDLSTYGLGALPDAPDERDYPLSALYASEGLTASGVLPASYAAPGMPPVLDQHATPMCVAFSSSGMKAWQDRWDQERFFDFDEPTFFGQIGGTPAGAYVRDAMERNKSQVSGAEDDQRGTWGRARPPSRPFARARGGARVRAEHEDATRDGAAVGARFHAAAEVREGMVGARGLGPPVPGRSAGARCRWAAAEGRPTSS